MTDFPENENLAADSEAAGEEQIKDEYSEYETVFGDPQEHKDKRAKGAKNNKKRILALVSSFLAVAILVGGTVAVIKLIPEKEDETADSSPFEDITLLDYDSDKFSSVTVTNPQGTFKFTSKTVEVEDGTDSSDESSEEESEPETQTVWSVEGVADELISSSSVSTIVTAASSITASRSVDKTAAECGMDSPVYTVQVTSEEYGDYSVLVGSDSPDGTGVYLQLSTDEKIYITDSSSVLDFNFELLDLASTESIAGITVPDGAEGYTSDDGTLSSFDTLTLSGSQFDQKVVIVPTTDEGDLATYATYLTTQPTSRIAENVDGFLTLYQSGLTVAGAYAFDVSSASLAAVGLDNPDIIVTMDVAGASRTFKFSKVDDSYYAVIADDSVMIHKVAASNISFADYGVSDMYASWVYLCSINTVSNLTITEGGTSYSFDIQYDDSEDAEETYIITHNGEKSDADNFKDFYQIAIGLACSDYTVDTSLSGEPAATMKFTFSADGHTDTVAFTKCSETKYQYSVNGTPMGKITSAAYNKLIKNVKLVSEGKAVVN